MLSQETHALRITDLAFPDYVVDQFIFLDTLITQ